MNIIVLGKKGIPSRTLNLHIGHLVAAIFVALALLGGGIWLGTRLAAPVESPASHDAEQALAALQARYDALQEAYEIREKQSQEALNALTLRLGQLQARMTRMEAVGERITDAAGLDPKEFDFESDPGVGGPQPPGDVQTNADLDTLSADLEALENTLNVREEQIHLMDMVLSNATIQSERFIAGRPIKKGWLSSKYGYRIDPFTGKRAWHAGVDFAGKEGSDIVASAGGVVTWAGDRYGYGLMVEISHGQGLSTRYAHAKELLVKKGDVVSKGQVIAKMGSTGRSTGPHVHYEVWKNGRPINPHSFIYRASR